jgi:uncharacterized phage protein (TIGR01671 family)
MRDFKFRALINDEMVILPLAALQYFDFEGSYALSFVVDGYAGLWAHEYYDNATNRMCKGAKIMQYTGINDCNGIEIYEGDVVSDTVRKYVVEWDIRLACFHLQFIYDEPTEGIVQTSKPFPIDGLRLKVIGNIYQNK